MSEAPPKNVFFKGLRHKFFDICQLLFEKNIKKMYKT